jgi:uncharacterized damage-inducible protein DinB
MADDRDELLQHYARMREEMLSAIAGLNDEQMTEQSLDGWSIKDHLAHVALWDEVRAAEVARISAGHDSAFRMSEEQDRIYNELGFDLRRALTLEQVRWELTTSRQKLLDAISAATSRGLDESLYGEAPIRSMHERLHAGWIRRWRGERGI